MDNPTVFYLIRHAEPEFGGEKRICLGRKLDVPLSETGRKQASLLGEQFCNRHLDAVYTSPLIRAKQTADALPQNCPHYVAQELTEVDSGEWDGMRFADIYAHYPSFFENSKGGGGNTPPGGESDEEALARSVTFLYKLTEQKGKCFALVTHSGVGRILVCSLMGMPMYLKRTIPMQYASCTEIRYNEGSWRVVLSEGLLPKTGTAGFGITTEIQHPVPET